MRQSLIQIIKKMYRSSPENIISRLQHLFFKKIPQSTSECPLFYPDEFKKIFSNIPKLTAGNLARESKTGDELVMIVDIQRSLVLHQFLKAVLPISGDVVECGTYKGGTALILANVLNNYKKDSSKILYLFDSFSGLPENIMKIDGPHKKGDFGDATLEILRKRLSDYQYKVYPGFFKDTLTKVSDLFFCFVHIDVDIYSSAKECTEFFYPRVNKGGVLIYDDYGFESTKGVRKLVDEFYADKPESVIILPTRQCLIIKQ